jgi:hypothetical protein
LQRALESLWAPPLVRRDIDPDVAKWTGYPDTDIGLMDSDQYQFFSTRGCETLERLHLPGPVLSLLQGGCAARGFASTFDAGTPVVDESSPQALVTSVRAVAGRQVPIPIDDERRLATKLEALRGAEASSFGRARLSYTAGLLWFMANDGARAHAALLLSLRDDPLYPDTWEIVRGGMVSGGGTNDPMVSGAWFPYNANLVPKAGSQRGDELDARIRANRLGYVLVQGWESASALGPALAEAGRTEEARAVGATPLPNADWSRRLSVLVESSIDFHDAKIASGLHRLQEFWSLDLLSRIVAADVAGIADEVSTRWAERFLGLPEEQVADIVRAYETPTLVCMRARGRLATKCLDRVAKLGLSAANWWYEGGTALLSGARRYAVGDIRGAVSAWRPLVACSDLTIVRTLPTEAFDKAGEHELAARLDARKMPYTFIAGVSDAAPREAKRALAAGDTARAKELATAIVGAWEVADVQVPAVAEMRALLAKIAAP